jgi:hypothetical protein
MNDLRVVGCGSTLDYHDMNATSCEDTAAELVDSLLLGNVGRRNLVRGDVERVAFYDDLHKRHDARSDAASLPFNENWPKEASQARSERRPRTP